MFPFLFVHLGLRIGNLRSTSRFYVLSLLLSSSHLATDPLCPHPPNSLLLRRCLSPSIGAIKSALAHTMSVVTQCPPPLVIVVAGRNGDARRRLALPRRLARVINAVGRALAGVTAPLTAPGVPTLISRSCAMPRAHVICVTRTVSTSHSHRFGTARTSLMHAWIWQTAWPVLWGITPLARWNVGSGMRMS